MKKILFLFYLGLFFINQGNAAAPYARALGRPDVPVPQTYFGFHAHRLGTSTVWPLAPFGTYRAWDAKVRWADLEPMQGKWAFARLDYLVNESAKRNIEFLLPLGMPPSWASSEPAQPSAYGPGEAAPPKNDNDWSNYVRTVATRYRGKVKYYEIWNEPNLPKFYSGSPKRMVELTCLAKTQIALIDKNARLVSPAPLGDYGVKWLSDFLREGGGGCIDIVGYHFYNKHRPPETHIDIARSVRLEMAKYGVSKLPIWNTESGWLISDAVQTIDAAQAGFRTGDFQLAEKESASYLIREFVLHWVAGIDRSFFYAWDNGVMGLINKNGSLKPGALAIDQLIGLMKGRTIPFCSTDNIVWQCELKLSSGVVGHLLWSVKGDIDFSIPDGWSANDYLVFGESGYRVMANRRVLRIGGTPVYLRN